MTSMAALNQPTQALEGLRVMFLTQGRSVPSSRFRVAQFVDGLERIRSEKCDAEVVENAKASFIGNVVNPFSSRNAIVNTFAEPQNTHSLAVSTSPKATSAPQFSHFV